MHMISLARGRWGADWSWRLIMLFRMGRYGRPVVLISVGIVLMVAVARGEPAPRVVTIPERDYSAGFWGPYFRRLLELALEATQDTHGPFEVRMWNVSTQSQDRELYELQQGTGLDVVWSMTSRERERMLRPIRIPLVKGLLGYRIFLVRTGEESRFAAVTGLEGLGDWKAGQGTGWPDVDILMGNGVSVVEGRDYEGLFGMLREGRFDYFPRGVTEVWDEVAGPLSGGLAVEPTLLLYYPTAVYFFVRPDAQDLAGRLEAGLERLLRDGRFDTLFLQYNGEALRRANLEGRRMMVLENPLLSPETPRHRQELWYHVGVQP